VFVDAFWPALWPAAAMTTWVVMTAPFVPSSLLAVAAEMLTAAGIYGALFFFFGLKTQERRLYVGKVVEMIPWRLPVRWASEGA
jgi:hypothetical protein